MGITNPPFKYKKKILEKLFSFGKPFAVLLPMSILVTMYGKNIFCSHHRGTVMIPIAPKVKFLKLDKQVQVGDIAWFVGNLQVSVYSIYPIVLEFVDRDKSSKETFMTDDEEAFEEEVENDQDCL